MSKAGFSSLHDSAIQLEELDHCDPVFGLTHEDLQKIMLGRDPDSINSRSKLEHIAQCLKTDLVAGLSREEEENEYRGRKNLYPNF